MRRTLQLGAFAFVMLLPACEVVHVQEADGSVSRTMDTIVARLFDRPCGLTQESVVTGNGIGSLTVGASVEQVRGRCRVIDDTTGALPDPQRVIRVDLYRDTAIVFAQDGRISRIELTHSPFRTADSLGVGRYLTRLLQLPDVTGETIDGRLYALSPAHCGLAFELANPAPAPPAPQSGVIALRRLPGETSVRRLLIFGCRSE